MRLSETSVAMSGFNSRSVDRNSVREHLQKSKNPDNLAPLWNPKKLAKQMYQIFAELYF